MEVELEFGVGAPPHDVAALLMDFEGLPRWHPGIEGWALEGSGAGAVRTYRLGGNPHRERLDERDDRAIRYTILEGPLPLSEFHASYEVRDAEGGSRITWRAAFVVMPQLEPAMGQAAKLLQISTLELLKAHLECGVALV